MYPKCVQECLDEERKNCGKGQTRRKKIMTALTNMGKCNVRAMTFWSFFGSHLKFSFNRFMNNKVLLWAITYMGLYLGPANYTLKDV
jgi:hypothetical protein